MTEKMTSTTRISRALIAVILIGVAAIAAAAPVSVEVVDRDLEIPLEGVAVLDPATGVQALTGPDGSATIDAIVPPSGRIVLQLSLIGYEPVRVLLREDDLAAVTRVKMVIQGLLVAEELVIEAPAVGASSAPPGVSVVAERDLVKTTAMIGPIEDAMNTVKILPGVTYAGGFNSFLSVRGGDPGGLTHVEDGLVIKYPYHWGGGVSVFNPHMVERISLSAGIFPVRYGQATSGLMEVESVSPTDGLRWSVAQSTSTLEGYAQVPLGARGNAGVMVGARLTNYDLVFAMTGGVLEDQGLTFSRVPYIYAGYGRFLAEPNPRTRVFFNAFLGTDGIGLEAIDPDADPGSEIVDTFDFFWQNRVAYVGGGVRRLVGDRLVAEVIAGYEDWTATVDGSFFEGGTKEYSQAFIDAFGMPLGLSLGDTFSVDAASRFVNSDTLRHLQGRVDLDYELGARSILQLGGGAFRTANSFETEGDFWGFVFDEDTGQAAYVLQQAEQAAPANRSLVSFGYVGLVQTLVPQRLEAEFGLRADHGIFFGDGYTLNTRVSPGPRLLARYTPGRPRLAPEVTWSLGSGIFTKVPFDAAFITEDLDLDENEVGGEKSFTNVVGWHGLWSNGVRFRIEGYYKYVYDRVYVNQTVASQTPTSIEYDIEVNRDGIGHVGGFDFLLDRRTSASWDGMISYSFVWARYRNPNDDGETPGFETDPRGRWYYPSFHRFHSLNLLVNWKPTGWFTLTPKVTFATGTPQQAFGERQMIAATIVNEDGSQTIAEMYTRETSYSDSARQAWVLPVDIRASFHWYRRGTRRSNEAYLGVQDALSPILARWGPDNGTVDTDRYTGEDTAGPGQDGADFPIISIGYRVSF